jgi:hypothetical protein
MVKVRELMTAEDVERRLDAREDPLKLSIEKWEILVERWSDKSVDILVDIDEENAISWITCSLCVSTMEECKICPYYTYYHVSCVFYHFQDVEESLGDYDMGTRSRKDVVIIATKMLDALKEIRDNA